MRIFGERAHAWQIDMHVRINEAGEDVLAARVNDLGARRRRDVWLDARNGLVGAVDVCDVAISGGDDFAVLDEQSHARFVNPGWGVGQQKRVLRGLPGNCDTLRKLSYESPVCRKPARETPQAASATAWTSSSHTSSLSIRPVQNFPHNTLNR